MYIYIMYIMETIIYSGKSRIIFLNICLSTR